MTSNGARPPSTARSSVPSEPPSSGGLRTDLTVPNDVAELVRTFYADVAQDDVLGPLFNDVAQVDWSEHLPKLTAFWCRALFGMQGYSGNPYRQHSLVNDKSPFTIEAFERWLELFTATIDSGWEGPNVERAKALARNVARVHSTQLIGEAVDTTPFGDDPTDPLSVNPSPIKQ